jgi:hypothetical protein
MNVTNDFAAGEKRKSSELVREHVGNTRDDAGNNGHNHVSESLEQDFTTESTKCSQAQAGYWKHRKEVRDQLSRESYTGLPSLDPVHLQALTQLVENYNEAVEETAAFNRERTRKAAQQLLARRAIKSDPDEKEILAMIVGTGDAMDASALKRRQLLIAESPNATPEILAELAMSSFSEVREAVTEHRLCPVSIQLMLAEDECPDVRFALAENHNMPFVVLEKLSNDENPFVSMRAERTMRRVLFDNVVCLEIPSTDDDEQSAAIG